MSLFGTSGVRGIANECLSVNLAIDVAKAFGTYLKKGTIVIGRDTRISGDMLKSATIAGVLSTGIKVIDVGIASTPAIQYYTRDFADGGIIITASHNPREYNGIKLIAGDGTELSRECELEVEKLYESKKFMVAPWNKTGDLTIENNSNEYYIKGIMNSVDSKSIIEKNFKVITDTGCGVGSVALPFLLQKLGCQVLTLNAQIDGTFPWRNPEPINEVLTELKRLVKDTGAVMGVAQDGDADRAVFIDENGEFIDEDVLLAMVTKYVLNEKKGSIVTPVSSSQRMKAVAVEAGVDIIWTAVGSINVAAEMIKHDSVFGGEGNGGLIFPEHQYCRDGAMACAKLLEIIASGTSLSELAKSVPEYSNAKVKIKCENLDEVMEQIKNNVLNQYKEVDVTDGVKIWYDHGWLLIRPSGTEPIIRVFAESNTESLAKELLEEGINIVNSYVNLK
ncbi:MAG: phosphoglucosamine mutase [Methanosarcinales archaeon]|jgi:phosphomannomutase/phosphoglucomutase|nr:phosphoglucosamine mutase [Methanosarcinales archaeon]